MFEMTMPSIARYKSTGCIGSWSPWSPVRTDGGWIFHLAWRQEVLKMIIVPRVSESNRRHTAFHASDVTNFAN